MARAKLTDVPGRRRAEAQHRVADEPSLALGDEQRVVVAGEPLLVLRAPAPPALLERDEPAGALGHRGVVLVQRAPERLELVDPLGPASATRASVCAQAAARRRTWA